jgi:predicted membrane-bound mannosyltransferase
VKRVDFNPDDDFKIRKLTFPARDESSTIQPSAEKNSSLSARLLIGLALLALLPRLVNLGSFSMWFDEVAETLQASGLLAYTWAELKSDVVHPPLDGLLTWSLLHLGIDETRRRLVPIVFGVVTVLLLASWASRRFGRIAGVATGLFAACSPIHVHYSQELRPYALALFFVALAVVAVDRALDHVDGRRLGLAALALLGCLYSLTGRAVLVAALCGTVGVELLLLHANHWSSPRYDLIGWLFLPVLAGMGTGFLLRLPGGRAVTAAALLFLVFA